MVERMWTNGYNVLVRKGRRIYVFIVISDVSVNGVSSLLLKLSLSHTPNGK